MTPRRAVLPGSWTEPRLGLHRSAAVHAAGRSHRGRARSADKRSYQGAVRYLKAAKKTAAAAGAVEFDVRVAGLRETHRRRPSLIAMLDKAGFV
jgi:uncharacterized Zn finger protein